MKDFGGEIYRIIPVPVLYMHYATPVNEIHDCFKFLNPTGISGQH
jgi:hypothetical protein